LRLGFFLLIIALLIVYLALPKHAPLVPSQTPGSSSAAVSNATLGYIAVPDPRLSPGDVLTTDTKTICMPGYTKTVRNVPQSLKNQVYREYGIFSHKPGEFEIDHIISLELGGSNSIRNLFPQSYVTQPLNAHVKDRLENKLHALVCSGQLPIQEAQKAIAENWTAAYVKYVGPLPGGARIVQESGSVPIPSVKSSRESSGSSAPASRNVTASGSASPKADGSCPPNAPAKVSRSGIYHLPGDPTYSRTHARRCFASAQAASAGYLAPKGP
jgi:hypothetical protein